MITTELIVLLAFASRFSLDRKLSDLKENIMEKQEILEVNVDLEQNIRGVQDKINSIKSLMNQQSVPIDTVILVHTLMPMDTHLKNLRFENGKITSDVIAESSDSFSAFLNNFSASNNLSDVEISRIGKGASGITFALSAKIKPAQKEQTKTQ